MSRDLAEVRALVVPLDGSALSREAVTVGTRLASRLDADLHLVSAVRIRDDIAERRRELAGLDVDLPSGQVRRSVVHHADPAAMIQETLTRIPGAVAVMATHGQGRSAAPAGSVAMAVIACSRHPVVLTCPLVEARAGTGVLACIDTGPHAAPVVAAGQCWAEQLGEMLTVVTVAENGTAPEMAAALATLVLHDPIGPASALHQRLCERPASLVVAGARAGSGLARLVLGRVTAALVRHSPSPVLVLPARLGT
jgi:nucleotide-binding universal stress UspA family protein